MSGIHHIHADDYDNGDRKLIVWFCVDCELACQSPSKPRKCPTEGCGSTSLKPFGYAMVQPMHVHDMDHAGFARLEDMR